MKNKDKRTFWMTTLLCLLPMLLGVILFNKLPEQIPTHFNFEGTVDGYSSKIAAVYGLPLFLVFINAVVHFSVNTDPKNKNGQNVFMINIGKWTCPIVAVILIPSSYYIALGNSLNVAFIVSMLVGILFIVIGNYLPKCKQNYTIGIKLPWTLNSEKNWNCTHRLAGFLWVLGGLLMIGINLIQTEYFAFIFFFVSIVLMTIVPAAYSYILYRKGI